MPSIQITREPSDGRRAPAKGARWAAANGVRRQMERTCMWRSPVKRSARCAIHSRRAASGSSLIRRREAASWRSISQPERSFGTCRRFRGHARRPARTARPAVTVIPGVAFSGSVDGHLRAYATQSGDVLWDMNTAHAIRGREWRDRAWRLDGCRRTGRGECMVFANSG